MANQTTFVIVLLVILVFCYDSIYGKPAEEPSGLLNGELKDDGTSNNNSTRVARTIKDPFLYCSERGGCYNGKCWAGCRAIVGDHDGGEWCYTTQGNSQDYQYIPCSIDFECHKCWKCAGPCAVF